MDVPPIFNSVEDECRFWKERAKFYFTEWMDGKQEFEDYIEQSRQVEVEMDATLDQKEVMIKDLRMKLANSEKEIESLKVKHENHNIEFANVEKQLENVRKERDTIKENLRQLEQKNDDLERAHRILNESIVDFERMLDKAYEKNALLEMEVDEKEMLQEKLQRLMDETRDLKQELNVKARCTPNATANNSITAYANSIAVMEKSGCEALNVLQNAMTTNNILPSTTATPTSPTSPTIKKEYSHRSLKNSENLLNGNAMTASSRTNALNIVADMLRKLNAMETKLKTYRDQSSTMHPRQ